MHLSLTGKRFCIWPQLQRQKPTKFHRGDELSLKVHSRLEMKISWYRVAVDIWCTNIWTTFLLDIYWIIVCFQSNTKVITFVLSLQYFFRLFEKIWQHFGKILTTFSFHFSVGGNSNYNFELNQFYCPTFLHQILHIRICTWYRKFNSLQN